MKRMATHRVGLAVVLSLFGSLVGPLALHGVSAATVSDFDNGSLEQMSGTTPTNWKATKWGSSSTAFSVPTSGAQNGQRFAQIIMTNRRSGDARWEHSAVNVVPGRVYTFSTWYSSNVATEVDVAVTNTSNQTSYYYLGAVAASSAWKQTSFNFTMPAGAAKASFYHLIARNGTLKTDNYTLTDNTTGTTPPPAPSPTPTPTPTPTPSPTPTPAPSPTPTPTPSPSPTPTPSTPFSKPLVSIEFDDGWTTAYNLGLPAVESFGWKPTQYIITDTAINNANFGNGTYMTPAQISDWNRRADIGSHSVTHAHIPMLSNSQITAELTNSKTYLDGLLGEPTRLYVSPYCESSNTVVGIAQSLYQSVRNCDPVPNTKANFNRWGLKSFIVLNTTSDTELRNILSQTKSSNGWLILVWHEIAGDNKNAWSVSQATLLRQLQIVKDSGIEVIPTQQALNFSLGL